MSVVFEDDEFEDDWWDDEDEDDEEDDEVGIEFVFRLPERQLEFVHTVGLWSMGLPELYLQPPADLGPGAPEQGARRAVLLATGLMELSASLLDADDFEIPPHQVDLDGRTVRFWLAGQEPPPERIAVNLDPEVDTVMRVDCSLWHASLLGDG